MSARELAQRIRRRAREEDAPLSSSLASGLERYYQLLTKWNARINLTSLPLPPAGDDRAIDRLLIEPLVAAKHLPPTAQAILDVGSGGGSPAIPLKLAASTMRLRMVEAKVRKAVFLRQAVRELGLADVAVETSRFEELLTRPELHEAADVITLRAVRVESSMFGTLQAFLKPGGQIFLFRGPGGGDVTQGLTPPLRWTATHPYWSNNLYGRFLRHS
ncbi:MAG: 16S rRNA (guanine(527)-N(7))-methyltransferase RsmG [Acidobacteria bacterium]|nr:16S rRNA (guanine(527)-N(7))-methyltransferase RsmG [Acidobacteriota bacterium]